MVNSASAALAEFKSQRLGTLLGGTGSTVDIGPTGLSRDAMASMQRTTPKKSSTAFLSNLRESGSRTNGLLMQNIKNKQQLAQQRAQQAQMVRQPTGSMNYRLPNLGKPQTGGPRGQNGLTMPAERALGQLSSAYSRAGFGPLRINSGGRTYAQQAQLYAAYKAGRGNKAAPPGTSLHESGIAVDLGGPLYNTNMGAAVATRQHTWMRQNAAKFGWYWVGKNYGESWHWEYHPQGR